MSQRSSRAPYLYLALVAAALDLITKEWVFRAVPLGSHRRVIDGFFDIWPHVNDRGPWSWGFGVDPGLLRWALPVLSVVAIVVLFRLLREALPGDRARAVGFALILGGAAGNLWDRVLAALLPASHGGVRDFLLFPTIWFGKPFPAFNLADAWITVGVAVVAWRILFENTPAPAVGTPGPAGAAEARGTPADEAGT